MVGNGTAIINSSEQILTYTRWSKKVLSAKIGQTGIVGGIAN